MAEKASETNVKEDILDEAQNAPFYLSATMELPNEL